MAEGGGEFGYKDPNLDYNLDHDDGLPTTEDPNDYEVDEEELNTTQPFRTSTPYGEQIPMQTMQHEQSGLPSYEETSFGGDQIPLLGDFLSPEEKQGVIDRSIDFIKRKFPNVDLKKLGPISFSKKGTKPEIVSLGPKGGETKIFKQDGSGFLKSFTDKFSKSLGKPAEQIIAEDRDTIQEQRQRLAEAEKQQQEAEKIAAERDKELQEMENIKQQTERVQARIDALQEEHGSNIESEAELRRLKQLKKNHQTEYENKKKEVAALEKQAKNNQKVQEKVQKERAKLDEIVKKRNLIEERLNTTKPLDDLNERETELRQQNDEDQTIIDATDTSPSEKEAARDRIEERNEELARLQTQIVEREEAMPLRERVKEIFKKKWCYHDNHLYCLGRRYCCSYERPHQRFESNRKGYGKRPKRNSGEAWLSAAWTYRPDCDLPFQNRFQSSILNDPCSFVNFFFSLVLPS